MASDRLSEERVRRFLTIDDFGEDFCRLNRIACGVRIDGGTPTEVA
jgi:hypothetical protein